MSVPLFDLTFAQRRAQCLRYKSPVQTAAVATRPPPLLPQPGGLHRCEGKSNATPLGGLRRAGLLEPSPDSLVLALSVGYHLYG